MVTAEVKRYKVLSKHPNDEFIDLQVGVKLDSHQVVRFLNESYNYIEELRKENRKLTEELDKYKETVQELQGTSSKMFDKSLENHLSKFQENPYYNEENEEFKNDIKLLIQVAKQIKDFKNSQNQVAIDVLHDTRNTLRFHTYNIKDDRFAHIRTMCLWTDINKIIDKQIESLKGE